MRDQWARPSPWQAALVLAATAVFLLHLLSPADYTGSDARFSLFFSQAMLDTGSFQMDSMSGYIPLDASDYRLFEANGHTYYSFPFGSSIFSLPFVWAANQLGIRITITQVETSGMNLIAAVAATALFLLLAAIGRAFLERWRALALALIVMLGSSLTSTLATSLWSLNFTLLFYAFSLWLIVRFEMGQDKSVHPAALGFSLFAAFLCRPTAAIFILLVFAYLFIRSRRQLAGTAVVSLLFLLGFSLIVYREMGAWLLPYYIPSRLEGTGSPWWVVWYGLLFSPGRGLFVFTPIFLAPLLALPQTWRSWVKKPLFWLAAVWISLQITVVSTFPSWWGGFSFGPRLLTDITPAFYLLLLLWAREMIQKGDAWRHTTTGRLFPFLVVASLFINSYAGLFNAHAQEWNGGKMLPHVDRAPEVLLDWRHPQFLATEAGNCERNQAFHKRVLADRLASLSPYTPKVAVTFADADNGGSLTLPSPGVKPTISTPAPAGLSSRIYLPLVMRNAPLYTLMSGWRLPQQGRARALCDTAVITIGPLMSGAADEYIWLLTAVADQPTPLSITVNGVDMGELSVGTETAVYRLPFSSDLLSQEQYNQITFRSVGDGRLSGNFQFISLIIEDG